MARQPPQRDVAPAVQKLRVRYAKRGRLRFTSHRDIQRAFERALRRAGVPMAYSAGFSPHPKISYAGAAAMGPASEAEYLEISVTQRLDPGQGPSRRSMPRCPLAWTSSRWSRPVPGAAGRPARGLAVADRAARRRPGSRRERAVEAFLAATEVEVERLTKSGIRRFDARGAGASTRRRRRANRPNRAPVRYCEWSSGTSHPPFDPTTSSPPCTRWRA